MSDDGMGPAWEKAEKAITKGKGESALKILRDADPDGKEVTTLRLAGHATWLNAKANLSLWLILILYYLSSCLVI